MMKASTVGARRNNRGLIANNILGYAPWIDYAETPLLANQQQPDTAVC